MSSAEEAVAPIDDGPADNDDDPAPLAPILSASGDSCAVSYETHLPVQTTDSAAGDEGQTDMSRDVQMNAKLMTRTRGIFGPLAVPPGSIGNEEVCNPQAGRRRSQAVGTGTSTATSTATGTARNHLFSHKSATRPNLIERVIGTTKKNATHTPPTDQSTNMKPSDYFKNNEKVKALQVEVEALKIENEALKRKTDEMQAELVRRARVIALQRERCAELNSNVETFNAMRHRAPSASISTNARRPGEKGCDPFFSGSMEKGDDMLLHPRNSEMPIARGARRRGASLSRLAVAERESDSLDGLMEEVNKLKMQRDTLRASNEAMSKLNKEAEAMLKSKKDEKSVVTGEVAKLLDQKVLEKKQCEALKLECDTLTGQVKELQARRAALEANLKELEQSENAQLQKLRQMENKWSSDQEARKANFDVMVTAAKHELDQCKETTAELRAEQQRLEISIAEGQQRLDEIQDRINQLQSELELKEKRIREIESELVAQEQKLESSHDELTACLNDREKLLTEIDELRRTEEMKRQQLEREDTQLAEKRIEVESINRDQDSMKEALNQLRLEYEEWSQKHESQILAAKEELASMQNKKNELEMELKGIEQLISYNSSKREQRVSDLAQEIAYKEKVLADRAADETALLIKIEKAAAEYQQVKARLEDCATKELGLQTELQKLVDSKSQLQTTVATLTEQKSTTSSELLQLADKKASLENQIHEIRMKMEEDANVIKQKTETDIQECHKTLKDLEQEKEIRLTDIRQTEAEAKQLRLGLEELRDETSKLEQKQDELTRNLREKRQEYLALQDLHAQELSRYKEETEEEQRKVNSLKAEIKNITNQKEGLEGMLLALEQRKVKAEEEFKDLSVKVGDLTKMIEELRQEESAMASSRKLSLNEEQRTEASTGLQEELTKQKLALAAEHTALAAITREHDAHVKIAQEEMQKWRSKCEFEERRMQDALQRRLRAEEDAKEAEATLQTLQQTLRTVETQCRERREEEHRRTERLEADRSEAKQQFDAQLLQKQQELRTLQAQLSTLTKDLELERQRGLARLDVDYEKKKQELADRLKEDEARLQNSVRSEHQVWLAKLEASHLQRENDYREKEAYWLSKLAQMQRRYDDLKQKTRPSTRDASYKMSPSCPTSTASDDLYCKLRGANTVGDDVDNGRTRGGSSSGGSSSVSASVVALKAEIDSLKRKQFELSLVESKLNDKIKCLQGGSSPPPPAIDEKRSVRLESFPAASEQTAASTVEVARGNGLPSGALLTAQRSQSFEAWSTSPTGGELRDRRWQQELNLNQTLWRSKLAIAATRRRPTHDSPPAQESPLFSLPEEDGSSSNGEQENAVRTEMLSSRMVGSQETTQTTATEVATGYKSALPSFGMRIGTSSGDGDELDGGVCTDRQRSTQEVLHADF